MMRGFAKFPKIATMEEAYGLKAVAIAVYPMYRGLARLVGMTVVEPGKTLADQMEVAKAELGQVRLLLHPLQVHRQHRRGRQLRQEGRDDRGPRRRDPQARAP